MEEDMTLTSNTEKIISLMKYFLNLQHPFRVLKIKVVSFHSGCLKFNWNSQNHIKN